MKFIVGDELGRLLKWLRILGFDAVLEKDKQQLVMRSLKENRLILTRCASRVFCPSGILRIKDENVLKQLEQAVKELNLKIDRKDLFSRCPLCNSQLAPAEKLSVKGQVPEFVFNSQKDFTRCPQCQKIYWLGSHYQLVNKFLDSIHI